jgi:imidazole glycerol-phosphate synthase subunit HisF
MLRPRIIPCLLVRNKGLVKTINFKASKYIGDPINAVKIFNEKEVDEIVVLDIDATVENRQPDYLMIKNLAEECRMPLCYGGGVKTLDQVKKIIGLGVEKVAISSSAIKNEQFINKAANSVGNQSVVVVLDIKKRIGGRYEVYTHNATIATGINPFTLSEQLEKSGVGEIVINSIDNDGIMKGYDLSLIEKIRGTINIPLTVIGGAGSLEDIHELIQRFRIIGASAGSLFVFKGKYKAVLINYPNPMEKEKLIQVNKTIK